MDSALDLLLKKIDKDKMIKMAKHENDKREMNIELGNIRKIHSWVWLILYDSSILYFSEPFKNSPFSQSLTQFQTRRSKIFSHRSSLPPSKFTDNFVSILSNKVDNLTL